MIKSKYPEYVRNNVQGIQKRWKFFTFLVSVDHPTCFLSSSNDWGRELLNGKSLDYSLFKTCTGTGYKKFRCLVVLVGFTLYHLRYYFVFIVLGRKTKRYIRRDPEVSTQRTFDSLPLSPTETSP